MLYYLSDYTEGAHPRILERLQETNLVSQPGYGEDRFCAAAREKIRAACGKPEADVYFLVGGTQCNAVTIASLLQRWEAVIAADTGHINVHEAGAVEFTGHKVIALPQREGKLSADTVRDYCARFFADETHDHMPFPGMVYISQPTELGTLYTKAELSALHAVCGEYGLRLFVDGARLGYGLMSPAADLTLPELARLCDVFYIGGTKVGALCGEAVVFPRGNAPRHFFTLVKQHGALLAKGRLLGIQFDTLFTDGLYFQISRHALEMAARLKDLFLRKGIPLSVDSPTNQQFPILTPAQMQALDGKVLFEVWDTLPDGRAVTRFATSWATTEQQIDLLAALL
jgi:threonine aldolase